MPAPQRPTALWSWSVAALSAAVVLNFAAPHLAAAALREAFQRALQAPQVDVAVESWPPVAVWWGRIDRLGLRAARVRAGDLELAEFRAIFRGLRLDPAALYGSRQFVLRAAGPATAQGIVSEAALASLLRRRGGVRLDGVELRPGRLTIDASVPVFGADVPVHGDGRLVLGAGGAIDLVLDRAGGGAAAGGMLSGAGVARVPAVLRVPALPIGFHLTAIRITEGALVLDAVRNPL
jgi:hypothetical protein